MKKQFDAVALGEILMDLSFNGREKNGNGIYEASPGGAPCNMISAMARLGLSTAFLGKVSNDGFGKELSRSLSKNNIDISGLTFAKNAKTPLAFINNSESGERSFSFYHSRTADTTYCIDEINTDLLENTRLLHIGSLMLSALTSRKAIFSAVNIARHSGALVSFDVNLRPSLWDSSVKMKKQTLEFLSECDIIKLERTELFALTGELETKKGMEILKQYCNPQIVFITDGKNGSVCFFGKSYVSAPAVQNIKTVDTTAAGDSFFGAAVAYLLNNDFKINRKKAADLLKFANAAAAVTVSRRGSVNALPTEEEVRLMAKELNC